MTIGPFVMPVYDDDKEPDAATSELAILGIIHAGMAEAETRVSALEAVPAATPMDPTLFPVVGGARVFNFAEAVRAAADGAVAEATDTEDLLMTYGPLVPAGDPQAKWTPRGAGVTVLTDGTMAANSTTGVPSQSAVVTYVAARVALLVAAAPGLLDTLDELAAALGDDANFAATMTTALAGKLDKSTYDANSLVIATVNDTPIVLAMGASTVLMRGAAGDIIAGTPAQLRAIMPVWIETTGFTDATGNTRQTYRSGPAGVNQLGVRMATPGIVRGLAGHALSSRTAGTQAAEVYKNGSATGVSISWATGAGASIMTGNVAYVKDDILDVRQTSTSYTPVVHVEYQIWTEPTL